jgi:hypothetical protein
MSVERWAVSVGAAALVTGVGGAGEGYSAGAFQCRVSSLSERPVPGRTSFNYGNARIAVALPPRATFVAVSETEPGGAWVQKDGWIRTKLGWWAARGKPHVVGRRLDRSARPLRADVGPLSSTSSGTFYPSLLYFSSPGCWKLTATAGTSRLDAVVRVVKK